MFLPPIPLLDEQNRLLLRAATAPDSLAVPAFHQWRKLVAFDDVTGEVHRVMPALAALAARNNIDDPDLKRMRGVDRHVWATNALKMKHLLVALDVLEGAAIRPMLLKGGALFARLPELSARRTAGDYDLLVPPDALGAAASALNAAGFAPLAMSWQSLLGENETIDTSGTALVRGERDSLVDLHWRPLKYLHDPWLTREIFASAEPENIQERAILVPNPTHHLFLAIGRCDPHDRRENFQRLLEGQMLLAGLGQDRIDWTVLRALVVRYGLGSLAASYASELETACAVKLAGRSGRWLRRGGSPAGRLESKLRTIPPDKRTPLQRWFLARQERVHHRLSPSERTPSLREALLLTQLSADTSKLSDLRREILRRFEQSRARGREFVEGWFYAESEGRWTNGKLAALLVPLSAAQRGGEPVSFRGYLMPGIEGLARMTATGGTTIVDHRQVGKPADFSMSLVVQPEPKLGGNGLVLFWMPDATSPRERGESTDTRCLGLFLRNDPQNQPVL